MASGSANDDHSDIRKRDLASRVTVGIITALIKELAAVNAMLERPVEYIAGGSGAGRRYWLGEVPAKEGGAHVVAVAASGVGNAQAAARATLLLEHFPHIDAILMVGIAGAVPHPTKPSDHVRLGDIVVSNQRGVIQYDFVKEAVASLEHRHPPRPPSARLLEADNSLELKEHGGERPWEDFFALGSKLSFSERPSDADDLYDADDPDKQIPHPVDRGRRAGHPRVFRGPIASSHALLKNPKKRDLLRDTFGVKAIEMEGSGIADATWLHEVGYLVIRGTCDYCDSRKGDDWQMYAAVVAAAYARALLGNMPASVVVRPPPREVKAVVQSGAPKYKERGPIWLGQVDPPEPVPTQGSGVAPEVPLAEKSQVAPEAIRADIVYLTVPGDKEHCEALSIHLKPALRRLNLVDWHVGKVTPGQDEESALSAALGSAKMVLLMVSPEYLANEACRAAEAEALSRVSKGLRVIPVSVRTVASWLKEPFGSLVYLPKEKKGVAIAEWRSKDEAWADVAKAVSEIFDNIVMQPPK